MGKGKPYEVYVRIVEDHNELVLEYHRLEALFRESLSPDVGEEEAKRRNEARRAAYEELQEFERMIGTPVIDKAYRGTNQVNFLKNPELSPYALSSKGKEAHYKESKLLLQEHFKALKGKKCQVRLLTDKIPLYCSVAVSIDGDDLFQFIGAAAFDPQDNPVLFFFHYWRLSDSMLRDMAPQWEDLSKQRFAVPLAVQPASTSSGQLFFDWLCDLLADKLGMEIGMGEDLQSQFIEALRELRPNVGMLRQQFPEMAHLLPVDEKGNLNAVRES